MIISLILLIIGFVLLIKGADVFVEGSSSLASIFKIPAIIVGLTIVAFGTSAPEAAVSAIAAFEGSNAISISNVIGSNIFNLLVVIGACSLIKVLPLNKDNINIDFPFLIFSSILLFIFVITTWTITRFYGLAMILILLIFVAYLVRKTKNQGNLDIDPPKISLNRSILYIVGGLICILIGGDVVVNNAKILALNLGMSETLVGLTVVAIGTSLPELITSLTAVKKNITDIAIGNVIGSNFFNILFVLGISSLINPITVLPNIIFDLVFMIFITLIAYLIAKKYNKFGFKTGILFIILFIIYMVFIILRN